MTTPIFATSISKQPDDMRLTEVKKPREAVLALEMLATGHTYNDIADATGLSFSALSGLRARHEMPLEVRRKQLATDGFEMAEGARFLVRKKMEMLADDDDQLKKTNLKDLGIAAVMFQERALQALEGNKIVVEHRGSKPSLEDAMNAIAEARRFVNMTTIDVTETIEVDIPNENDSIGAACNAEGEE
jgi:hypothetical protein